MPAEEGQSNFTKGVQIGNADETVHWINAKIDFCGKANVNAYFESTRVDDSKVVHQSDGKEIDDAGTAAFRGRPLNGARLDAPKGYAFHLVSQKDQRCEVHATKPFVQHWNLDTPVSEEDSVRKTVDYVNFAAEVMS